MNVFYYSSLIVKYYYIMIMHVLYVLYVIFILFVLFNMVCKVVRLIVIVFCNRFKFFKAPIALTIYYEVVNLEGLLRYWAHGSTEYVYAVGAWTLIDRILVRYYIIRTLIFELRMTTEPTIYPVPDRNRNCEGPLHNGYNLRKILSI